MKVCDWKIDVIKFLAIFSVILIHSLSKTTLIEYKFQFTFWQAMPIFLFLIGYNYSKSLNKYNGNTIFFLKRLKRIFPAIIVFNFSYYLFFYPEKELNFLYKNFFIPYPNYGTYFIGMVFILIFIFPYVFIFINFLTEKLKNLNLIIIILFLIGAYIDIIFSQLIQDKFIYSILPIRYTFDIFLGILYFKYKDNLLKSPVMYIGLIFNIIWLLYYPFFIKNIFPLKWLEWWSFQHIFYFYTFFLVYFIHKYLPNIFNIKIIKNFGRASFNIYLFQSLFFTFIKKYFNHYSILGDNIKIIVYISICLFVGLIWYIIEVNLISSIKLWKEKKE